MTQTERTKAESALIVLDGKYIKIPAPANYAGSMKEFDNLCICHGCGAFHTIRSSFIAASLSIEFRFADKSALTIQARGCEACIATTGVISEAFHKGMTRAAYDRAAAELGAEPRPAGKHCTFCGTLDNPAHLNAAGAHNLCAALARLGKPTPPRDPDPRWAR